MQGRRRQGPATGSTLRSWTGRCRAPPGPMIRQRGPWACYRDAPGTSSACGPPSVTNHRPNSFLKDTCEQQKHLLYVMSCSHEELKLTYEELSVAHENLVLDHALLTNKLSSKEIKTSESSSHGSNDQLQNIANPCDVGKKHVSTSCDDLLSMSCTSHIDASSSSTMHYETNLVEENKSSL